MRLFNIKTKIYKDLSLKALIATTVITYSTGGLTEIISFKQMTTDITFLASDKLKGRANFSSEIDNAANYIAKRFADIGLKPFIGTTAIKQSNTTPALFLQRFSVSQIQPQLLTVSLNNKSINSENIAIASTMDKVIWQTDQVQTHFIGKDDNMSATLRKLNQQGGQHLVIINRAHEKSFKGYQGYFNSGLTKLSLEHRGAIVIVLADVNSIKNYNVNATVKITSQALTNVVGVLPGTQKADEIILYSAHYDHLGTTPDGKEIYNGADDDASGTTAVLNLAQYYAQKANNQRTIIFSAFTGEEIGGFGSKYFSQQLNPDNVIAMINIEMIGKPSKFGAGKLWMTGMERSNLGPLLNAKLTSIQTKIHSDPYPEQGLFYRSDNATLAHLGVPAHSFSSTQLDNDPHYHQISDDISSLDLNSMHKVIESLAIATQPLVDGDVTPTRVDKSTLKVSGKIY